MSTFLPDQKHEAPFELSMGLIDNPFAIPNIRCENGECEAHVRIGWFRSVSNIPHAFAVQSFVGELAAELGKDQKEMLLELLGPPRKVEIDEQYYAEKLWNYGDPYETYPIDTGRLRNVVELAAERAEWGKKLPARSGQGIAVHRSFLSYVATVVEVTVDKDGTVRVPRVDTAFDCGFAANPERIRSQVEGAAVMGMTLALHSAVTFKNGRAQQSNLNDYQMVRIDNFPTDVRVHIVPHPFSVPASGVGEPGVPPFAPALANAIYAATKKRVRTLPIDTSELREA
jgi:isoquinoline 1-oxidoreductase beta subunit